MKDIEVPKPPERRAVRAGGLVTAILAIILAVVSATERSIDGEIKIAEKNASEQWNYYYANYIRSSLSGTTLELLTLLSTTSPDKASAAIAAHKSKLGRDEKEEGEIKEIAKRNAAKAAALSSKRGRFALVETLMQIAIGACSIFIATAVRPFFWVGGCVALVALAYYAFALIA